MQNHIYFAAFDVTAEGRNELIQLFKEWTKAAAAMTEGKSVGDPANNKYLPPDDTGKLQDLMRQI